LLYCFKGEVIILLRLFYKLTILSIKQIIG
jgi:hypothetical protein